MPNSARVDLSSTSGKLDVANDNFLYVAFLSPDEKRVTIVVQNRDDKNDQNFILDLGEQYNLIASLKSGVSFILFEGYKSSESFPSKTLINKNNLIRTENFRTLLNTFMK